MTGRVAVAADALTQLVQAAADTPHNRRLATAVAALVAGGVGPARPPTRRWATPAETAETLGVSVRTIRRRASDGTLPAVRVGRSWRIDLAALDTTRH
jgi:excisionase family DNA binding protein